MKVPNKAPAPIRRPSFSLGALGDFVYFVCASPTFLAVVGEEQR
jgi:hypothetical protein